jgi:hypothetical protein
VLRRACSREAHGWARRGWFGTGRRKKKGKEGKRKGRKGKKEKRKENREKENRKRKIEK